MILSFDYDSTLDRPDVQEYVQELIAQGHEIFVTTMRYNKMLQHLWKDKPHNNDLYEIVDMLGIPRDNIIFTNMLPKSIFLAGSNCTFHLDDSTTVWYDITNMTKIPCVMVQDDYRTICNSIIETQSKVYEQE